MAEINNQYRILILYMLSRVEYPLTNTQITNFILEKDYTNYFTIQQTLLDLQTSDLVTAESTHSNTMYYMTEDGRQTLHYFEDKVSPAMKEDVASYFSEHAYEMKQETSVLADYYKATGGGYQVRCQARESERTILDVTIHCGTREQAKAICANWQNESAEVYGAIMDLLLK